MSQQQREAMYQRWLYIGLGVAAALIVLSLGIGALWQYQIMPNQVLAEVNGEKITRKEYWKYQDINLYHQARYYEELARGVTGNNQSQFLMYATQLDNLRKDIYGSTDVDAATLTQMVDDRLYIKAAEDQGVDMSKPVLLDYALNNFAPTTSPVVPALPSPTMIPERAAWATQTAEAQQTAQAEQDAMLATQQALQQGTPPAIATPVDSNAAVASPVAIGTPGATPIAEATPDPAVVRTNAESDYQSFVNTVLKDTKMSEDEYLEYFAKPRVARAHVDAAILNDIPQRANQVELSHIMVPTEERANEISQKIANGEITFEEAAEMDSIDMATANNGGQLGWVVEGELPEELDAVAFATNVGEVSQPVQSQFGWHLLKVTDKQDERALTPNQYSEARTAATNTFMEKLRAESSIKSDKYQPSTLPTPTQFVPPLDAPTPIVATPVPAPDLSQTPIAAPTLLPTTAPEASPEATPRATP